MWANTVKAFFESKKYIKDKKALYNTKGNIKNW